MSARHKRKAIKRERIAERQRGSERFDAAILEIGRILFARYMRKLLEHRTQAESKAR